MTYVIAEPCIGTKDTACVDVCPVDCIHPRKDEPAFEAETQLYIHPTECIDCGACILPALLILWARYGGCPRLFLPFLSSPFSNFHFLISSFSTPRLPHQPHGRPPHWLSPSGG